jgi:hypothetical protein
MAASSTAKKKTTRKKTTRKKASTRKASTKKAPEAEAPEAAKDTGPIQGDIEGEDKYKLKALFLEWEREDVRVRQSVQQQLQNVLARARRNDPGWLKANKARIDAVNAFIDEKTPDLPEGYAIKNVMLDEGTFRADFDPESRGKHVE